MRKKFENLKEAHCTLIP